MDIRCDHKKFGELADGRLEVKCQSKFCGAGPGVIVLHRFDPLTGELLETKRFREPGPVVIEEVQVNGSRHDTAAVRPS